VAPPARLDGLLLLGELGLDGSLRSVRGALSAALLARAHGMRGVLLPAGSAAEAAVVEGIEVYGVSHLGEVVAALLGAAELPRGKPAHLAHTSNSRLAMPFDLPSFALCPFNVAMFNSLYYAVQGAKRGPFLCGYDKFFFPLDGIARWNRMYGRRGFVQYQIASPAAGAEAGIALVLDRLTRARMASFLTTLKRFGPGNAAPLSFPEAGYTLALDLPMSGPEVLTLLDALDESVLRFGGRVYLAKDARLAPERLRAMYPRLDTWLEIKSTHDPRGRFSSDQSRRLRLDTLH